MEARINGRANTSDKDGPAVFHTMTTCSEGKPAASRKYELVQQFPLFAGISLADCRDIVSGAEERTFSAQQTIFFEGDPARKVLLITAGCMKLTQVGRSGCEVILRLRGAGELIAPPRSRPGHNHCVTARTIEFCTALVWEASTFESVSERFPRLRRNYADILGDCLQEMEERFREISTERAAPRLSHELVRLVYQVGRRVNGSIEIGLSREELAQMTAMTLFTVSRLLCKWEKRGIVSNRRGAVRVCNLPVLRQLAEVE